MKNIHEDKIKVGYYRRWKADGTEFYVNQDGIQVTESVAKTNLIESGRQYMEFRPKTKKTDLVESFQALGLSEAEAKIAADFRVR